MGSSDYAKPQVKDAELDPVVCVGDKDGRLQREGPDLEHAGTRRWMSYYVSSEQHLQDLAQSRSRHAFTPSTPDPANASPTLPLYFLEHPSPSSPLSSISDSFRQPLLRFESMNASLKSVFSTFVSHTIWSSQLSWLTLYFALNLLLTLSNKSVLTGFPFPYTLTALHALFSTLGGTWLRWKGSYVSKRLNRHSELILLGFSVLYAINIAVSNMSLSVVTVPVSSETLFHYLVCSRSISVSSSHTSYHTHFHDVTIYGLLRRPVQPKKNHLFDTSDYWRRVSVRPTRYESFYLLLTVSQDIRRLLLYGVGILSYPFWDVPCRSQDHIYKRSPVCPKAKARILI